MKAIILAAGFATRLYPLTQDKSKSLLEIKGKPIIDYILEKIKEIPIDEIIIITNNKFYNNFTAWRENRKDIEKIKILNNGVSFEKEKLGSIGDLLFVIDREKIDEDILVISGDNLFKCSLKKAYDVFKKENKDLSIFYDVQDTEEAKRFGVALVKDNFLVDFQEKPPEPKSTLCSTSIYFYKKETMGLIKKFNREAENKDQPGLFLQWLYKKVPVYSYVTKEKWIDIGTKEALEKALGSF